MSSVEHYMSTGLVMRNPKSSVSELAKVMVDFNVSSVAIIQQGGDEEEVDRRLQNNKEVIGILTERDIVKSIARGVSPDSIAVGSLMSPSPILSIGKDRSIEEAALLMMRNKVRHLLVEDPDSNEMVGIITTTDLARYLRKRMKETTTPALRRDNEEIEAQQRKDQSSSSETLLSEVWELYF